jgi:RNA polymerase sigma factor (sigma-70 family)
MDIYKEYHERLVNSLRRYDYQNAEEYAQEAWVRVLPRLSSFKGDILAYLCRTGINVLIDHKRAAKMAKNGLKIDSNKIVYPDIIHHINFDILPPTQRDVVLLRLMGYEYQEVSKIMGIPYGTLTAAYTYAVLKIRKDLVARKIIDGDGLELSLNSRTISAYKKRKKKKQ